jgi:basic membrane protein A and related proteins
MGKLYLLGKENLYNFITKGEEEMKRFYLLFVLALLTFGLFACTPEEGTPTPEDPSNFKIAMITDVGDIDDKSFNQGTWEGIVEYAEANNKTHDYYRPAAQSTADYVDTIELAIEDGARIIVTPGFLFEEAIFLVQDEFPEVYFILIDGTPHNADYSEFKTASNTLSILFKEHESGWLAGYSVVKDGLTELGFIGGMAVPAVVRFGVGFVAGAYYAAAEEGLDDFEFPAAYYDYLGSFAPSDETKTKAASWYNSGVQAIHAAAGGAGNSVMLAASELTNKWVVGVDIDQSNQSTRVITSALKGLGVAVQSALADIYASEFVGGYSLNLGAAENAVGIPTAATSFDRFSTFDAAAYNMIFNKLAANVLGAPSSPAQLEAYILALGYTVPAGLIAKANG